jgi:hypothetical protein
VIYAPSAWPVPDDDRPNTKVDFDDLRKKMEERQKQIEDNRQPNDDDLRKCPISLYDLQMLMNHLAQLSELSSAERSRVIEEFRKDHGLQPGDCPLLPSS